MMNRSITESKESDLSLVMGKAPAYSEKEVYCLLCDIKLNGYRVALGLVCCSLHQQKWDNMGIKAKQDREDALKAACAKKQAKKVSLRRAEERRKRNER